MEKKHLCQSASSLQQSHHQCSQRWEKQNPATKRFDQKSSASVKSFVSPGQIFHPGQPCTSQEAQTSQTPSPSPFINSIFTLGSFLDLGFSQGGGWSNEGWWWTFLSHDERRLAITIQLGLVNLRPWPSNIRPWPWKSNIVPWPCTTGPHLTLVNGPWPWNRTLTCTWFLTMAYAPVCVNSE